jgi:hypothetical protein
LTIVREILPYPLLILIKESGIRRRRVRRGIIRKRNESDVLEHQMLWQAKQKKTNQRLY